MKFALTRKFWFFLTFAFSFLFLLASYIPNFYEASITNLLPKERQMTPAEHMYTYDYNVYLSKIKQGSEGRWSVVDKYDNNPNQKGVFLQMLYLLAGKLFGIFGISPPLIFHILRTVLSSVWVLTIVYLNFYFLKNPLFAFFGVLLSLFAASWPVFYTYQGSTWIGMHMAWWQEMDVLKRISYIPHYTLNYIVISVLTVLLNQLSKSINNKQSPNSNSNSQFPISKIKKLSDMKLVIGSIGFGNWNFVVICLILFFSFFIHPSAGLLFLFSWVIYHLLVTNLMRPQQIGYFLHVLIYTFILFAVAAIPLIYFRYVTSDYPWRSLVDFDKFNRFPINVKEYVLSLGPVFFTGVLGLIIVLLKKEQKYLSLVSWVLGAFLAIFVFKKFPFQSELRFVQTANHIPLAILSVYFLYQLVLTLNKLILVGGASGRVPDSAQLQGFATSTGGKDNERQNLPKFNKWIEFLVLFSIIGPIIALGLAQSYFSIKAQTDFIHQRVVAGQPLAPYPPQVMYPLKDMYLAWQWLDKNTKNEDVVLSHIYAGNYIPAYSGNFVYLGHNPETPHYDERIKKLETFYSGTLSNQDAEKFLKEERIKYVVYGPQEKEKSLEDIKKYSFLEVVFDSTYVKIYKVKL